MMLIVAIGFGCITIHHAALHHLLLMLVHIFLVLPGQTVPAKRKIIDSVRVKRFIIITFKF